MSYIEKSLGASERIVAKAHFHWLYGLKAWLALLILGWILFDSALTVKNILGMLLAVMGMVVYSWAMESEKKAATPIPRNKSDMLDGEDVPLKARVSGLPPVDLEEGEMKS